MRMSIFHVLVIYKKYPILTVLYNQKVWFFSLKSIPQPVVVSKRSSDMIVLCFIEPHKMKDLTFNLPTKQNCKLLCCETHFIALV